MKTKMFYVSEERLIEAIRSLYPDKIKSKDYEYLISIYTKRIFEKQYKKSFYITFELDSKHEESDQAIKLTSAETIKIIRTYLEENTPVDFGLAPILENGELEGFSYPFQTKRFIKYTKDNFLNDLVNFIEIKAAYYQSPNLSLLILPMVAVSNYAEKNARFVWISEAFLKTVADKIRLKKIQLRTILIFLLKDGKPELSQIWPLYAKYKN